MHLSAALTKPPSISNSVIRVFILSLKWRGNDRKSVNVFRVLEQTYLLQNHHPPSFSTKKSDRQLMGTFAIFLILSDDVYLKNFSA